MSYREFKNKTINEMEGVVMEEKWINKNWWGSSFNFLEEVRSQFKLPKKIRFHDATLRDGEQMAGVVFRKDDKIEIAKALDSIGIDRIEAGMPAVSQEDFEAIKEISKLGLKTMVTVFARASVADIDKAVEAGAEGIILEVPSGYPRIKNQFPNWSYEDVKKKAIEGVKYAKSKGLYVIFFPYDTTRAEIDFLETLYKEVVEKAKPDSVAIVDTIGCALPQTIFFLVRKLKSWVNLPVEVHTHNDFGMGVATSIAGVTAGAEVVHGCLTGLGERTGNAPLEQVIIALKVLLGMEIGIDFKKLYDVCKKVSVLSKVPIPINQPIIGDVAFAREAGMGVKLISTAPTTLFPVNPAFLNRRPRMVLGKKSGKDSIEIKLKELNLSIEEDKISELLEKVKHFGIEKGTYLTDEEFISIVNQIKK